MIAADHGEGKYYLSVRWYSTWRVANVAGKKMAKLMVPCIFHGTRWATGTVEILLKKNRKQTMHSS
jgi:hypothetical protein